MPKSTHYCEPFGGSAAVLINREPSPVETYNDVHSDVVNFFRVLREQKDALIEAIGLTPFSREEFERAIANDEGISDLERARRFYILAPQVRTGLAQKASTGRWANCLLTSRADMAGALSSYHCPLMEELHSDWRRIESKEKIIHSVKTTRTEVLWINYELEEKAECQPSPRQRRQAHQQASLI